MVETNLINLIKPHIMLLVVNKVLQLQIRIKVQIK
jgi:hypothetical protein